MDESEYERGYPEQAWPRLIPILHQVFPVDVRIGRWNDKYTWVLNPHPECTVEQAQQAHMVLMAFDPWDLASGEVFDSVPALEEIREAYEDSHSDNEGAGDVGTAEHTGSVDSSDGGELVEAPADDSAGGPVHFSAEPVGDDSGASEPSTYPGVMVTGDPLKAAKNDAREALAQKQRSILDQYPWQDNLRDFDQLQSVRWAIAEGSHPPFNDEQQAEFDSLSTFSNWFGRVNQNAFNITVQIDDAQTVEAVQAIELDEGWPE